MSEGPENGRQVAAIGNAITRLHRDHYGRGATSTRTILQRNYVAVFLEDIYTPVERTLIDAGDRQTVKDTRQAFQMAMADAFTSAVAEISGRRVVAFMSQVHFEPDMAVEIFVLEPRAADDATAAGEPAEGRG
jgi:uncharacterized protein YbcI